jgi:DNA-binding transcriptional LysR family regulator
VPEGGFEPRVTNTRQTNMQIETIIDFVSNGLGISIMMDQAARYYHNPNYRIIRLKDTTTAHLRFCAGTNTSHRPAGSCWTFP